MRLTFLIPQNELLGEAKFANVRTRRAAMLAALLHVVAVAAAPIECTSGTERPQWPVYHFVNNITRNVSGSLVMEPLNDAK